VILKAREFIPNARICGGSFFNELPEPMAIPYTERLDIYRKKQKEAVKECIGALTNFLPEKITQIPHGVHGELTFPDGYVGSLTHKGVLVLGIIASDNIYKALGVDLELINNLNRLPSPNIIVPEGLPANFEIPLGTLISISAKEAIFKAYFPIYRSMLDFGNVTLKWKVTTSKNILLAKANARNYLSLDVICGLLDQWILSLAYLPI
jgi:4'-phosphopantetheinyl transferase EntD